MTSTQETLVTDDSMFSGLVFPLDVHVFEREGEWYAFDARTYAILQLNASAAGVLSRMHKMSLGEIVADLAPEVPGSVVRACYVQFLEMIQDRTLSIEPLPRPARPLFSHLVLMLAGGCNMGCTYCFERDVPIYQELNLMTRECADQVLEWYFKHQEGELAHVQLYGGEPTLNWPILTYVVERMEEWAAANGKNLTKYMITNGTLLDPERVAFLKAHDVAVQVSVDGDAETHNRFRIFKSGKPTMEKIKPNIDELARQGANFNLRAVLTRENKDPQSVIDGLHSLGGDHVSYEVVATDNCHAQFTDSDWVEFNEKNRRYIGHDYVGWNQLPSEVQSMIGSICQQRRVSYGCGAGVSEVTVSPDGSIYECQRIYRTPYSKISDDLGPTDLNSSFLTMVDDRPVCKDCWARYLCGGGCMHQAHVGHGSDEPLPQYCEMKRDLAEAAIVKIQQIRTLNDCPPPEAFEESGAGCHL